MKKVVQHLRRAALLVDDIGLTDEQLLESFIVRRDEAAFEAIVRRYGPMVLGICRRVVGHVHDADDAFQATFLVLVQKAATVVPQDALGRWLWGVAHRTALKAKSGAARYRSRQQQVTNMPDPHTEPEKLGLDLIAVIREELACLPDKYRTAIVMCDLEGRTRREAARQLQVADGTLSERLVRARKMLARSLARRGLPLMGGTAALSLSEAAAAVPVPSSLVAVTVKAAASVVSGHGASPSVVSANAAALTAAVLKSMALTKFHIATALVLAAGLLTIAAAGLAQHRIAIAVSDPPAAEVRAHRQSPMSPPIRNRAVVAPMRDAKPPDACFLTWPEVLAKLSPRDQAGEQAVVEEINADGELAVEGAEADDPTWLLGHAYKIPSQYTNQESGYYSLIEGHNGRLYIGAAKYGVNAYLIEFDPQAEAMKIVVDAHQVIGSTATGFAAQAKIHTRNNVGASGKIYFGSKQGYPQKSEKRSDYPGGYVFTYDPATGQTEHFGIAKPQHGIASVTPDEANGIAYISTCSDSRPIDHTHFMILDLKKKTYRDFGDMEQAYAFIVLDHQRRAYHPVRGGKIARFDSVSDRLEVLSITVDGEPPPAELTHDRAIVNWEVSPDRKTLYAAELKTNALFAFDLTASEVTIPGRRLGKLLDGVKKTDCRALCVAPTGLVWAAVTDEGHAGGREPHLVGFEPGAKAPRDHGPIAIDNPDYMSFTDEHGKRRPWHHLVRTSKDGTLSPTAPLAICAAHDGSVYVVTIAPFTLHRFAPDSLAKTASTQEP